MNTNEHQNVSAHPPAGSAAPEQSDAADPQRCVTEAAGGGSGAAAGSAVSPEQSIGGDMLAPPHTVDNPDAPPAEDPVPVLGIRHFRRKGTGQPEEVGVQRGSSIYWSTGEVESVQWCGCPESFLTHRTGCKQWYADLCAESGKDQPPHPGVSRPESETIPACRAVGSTRPHLQGSIVAKDQSCDEGKEQNDPAHPPAGSAAPEQSDPPESQCSVTPAAGGGLGAAAGSASLAGFHHARDALIMLDSTGADDPEDRSVYEWQPAPSLVGIVGGTPAELQQAAIGGPEPSAPQQPEPADLNRRVARMLLSGEARLLVEQSNGEVLRFGPLGIEPWRRVGEGRIERQDRSCGKWVKVSGQNDPAHPPAGSAAPEQSDAADPQRCVTEAAGGGSGAAAGSAVSPEQSIGGDMLVPAPEVPAPVPAIREVWMRRDETGREYVHGVREGEKMRLTTGEVVEDPWNPRLEAERRAIEHELPHASDPGHVPTERPLFLYRRNVSWPGTEKTPAAPPEAEAGPLDPASGGTECSRRDMPCDEGKEQNVPAHPPAGSAAPVRSDPAEPQRCVTEAAGGGLGAAAGSAVSPDSGSCGIPSHKQVQPPLLDAYREPGPTTPAQWRGLEAEFPEAYREGSPRRPLGFVISIYPDENGPGHEFGYHTGSETHWQSGRVESEPPCVCRSEGHNVSAAGLWRARLCGSPQCEESLRRLLDQDSDPAAASAVSMEAEKTQGHLRAEGASDDLHQSGVVKDQSCDEGKEQNDPAHPPAGSAAPEQSDPPEPQRCVTEAAGGGLGAAACSAVSPGSEVGRREKSWVYDDATQVRKSEYFSVNLAGNWTDEIPRDADVVCCCPSFDGLRADIYAVWFKSCSPHPGLGHKSVVQKILIAARALAVRFWDHFKK